MATGRKKSKRSPEEPEDSELWLDPARFPTRLAQRNPLASASLPQALHQLESNSRARAQVRGKNSKRRKPENAVLRYWMQLGDKLLNKQ
jgi:hypothetical protein